MAAATETVNDAVTGAFLPSSTVRVTVAVPAPTALSVIRLGCPSAAVTTFVLSEKTEALSASPSGSMATYGTSRVSPAPIVCGPSELIVGGALPATTVTAKVVIVGALMPSFSVSVTVAVPALTPASRIVPGAVTLAVATPGVSESAVWSMASPSGSLAM